MPMLTGIVGRLPVVAYADESPVMNTGVVRLIRERRRVDRRGGMQTGNIR